MDATKWAERAAGSALVPKRFGIAEAFAIFQLLAPIFAKTCGGSVANPAKARKAAARALAKWTPGDAVPKRHAEAMLAAGVRTSELESMWLAALAAGTTTPESDFDFGIVGAAVPEFGAVGAAATTMERIAGLVERIALALPARLALASARTKLLAALVALHNREVADNADPNGYTRNPAYDAEWAEAWALAEILSAWEAQPADANRSDAADGSGSSSSSSGGAAGYVASYNGAEGFQPDDYTRQRDAADGPTGTAGGE